MMHLLMLPVFPRCWHIPALMMYLLVLPAFPCCWHIPGFIDMFCSITGVSPALPHVPYLRWYVSRSHTARLPGYLAENL
jgi:hypothetical protein